MRAGIQRLTITNNVSGSGAWRFNVAAPYHGAINRIYRSLFNLTPLTEYLKCTAEERYARYDIEFGVDVLLNFLHGQTTTVQEKILTTKFSTVTVEYYQDWRKEIPGDWFNLKCDFYFVGYANSYPSELDRWILLDWNKVRIAGDEIRWQANQNRNDGARANFRYAHFDHFPAECVVGKFINNILTKNIDSSYGSQQYSFF